MPQRPWQRTVAVGFLIFGVLAMTQFKAQQRLTHNGTANLRSEDLIGTLLQVEQDSLDLQNEAVILEKRIENYQQSDDIIKTLGEELKATRVKAGLTPLIGPGLVVTLNDSELQKEQGVDPNNYYIHESFLREIVNAFWTGGAEGVAINNLRLIANSEIFCGGTTIFINKSLVVPPYKIMAVGDPAALKTSINMDVMPLLTSLNQQYGIKVEVQELKKVTIPAYGQTPKFQYARVQE